MSVLSRTFGCLSPTTNSTSPCPMRWPSIFFVGELARVAKQAYVVVPNRYFLVEHHTALPLLHYWDKGFQLACSVLGKSQWADDSNLILMDRKKLWEIAARTTKSAAVGYTGLRFGPMSSNIFLALH